MARLTIIVTDKGIQSVTARVRSVSEQDALARLSAKLAVGLTLLSQLAAEPDAPESPVPALELK